jgi:hypothetical protein
MDSNLYGAFPVKRLFWVVLTVFCSERERPFFVPSPGIRFAERAGRGEGAQPIAISREDQSLIRDPSQSFWDLLSAAPRQKLS